METFQLSLLPQDTSTSSQEVSLVSPIQQPENVKHRKTIGTCGHNSTELFARFSPDGVCLKMYGGYLVASLDGSLEEFSGTCPKQGLMLNGQLYQHPIWEPPIDENESGLLPTPNTMDTLPARPNVREWNNSRDGRKNRQVLSNLREAVVDPWYQKNVMTTLPTPTARDWKHGSSRQLNNPRSPNLNDLMAGTGEGSLLNPCFVEEMMGYPVGWTDIEINE